MIDSIDKMEKLQKSYETFREDMQQKFEEANKRQGARIRGLIQQNETLEKAKTDTDKKLTSQLTSAFESTRQWRGLTPPFGSTPRLTGFFSNTIQHSPRNLSQFGSTSQLPKEVPKLCFPPASPRNPPVSYAIRGTKPVESIPGDSQSTHTSERKYRRT